MKRTKILLARDIMFSPKRNNNARMEKDFAKWFSGKTALVTGATSGIGREIAKRLVCYGSRVLLCGRDKEAMDSLLKELNTISAASSEGFIADLSDRDSQQELIKKINNDYEIDIL